MKLYITYIDIILFPSIINCLVLQNFNRIKINKILTREEGTFLKYLIAVHSLLSESREEALFSQVY